ncbi:unnamed protein product [Arctogadus glacialis]
MEVMDERLALAVPPLLFHGISFVRYQMQPPQYGTHSLAETSGGKKRTGRIAATEEEREDASPYPPRHAVEIPGPTGCYDLFTAAWCGGLLSQTCERWTPRSAPERSHVRRRPVPLRLALREPGALTFGAPETLTCQSGEYRLDMQYHK